MNIVQEAFQQLYPERELKQRTSVKYSGKFKPFNANVKHSPIFLEFHLSRDWKTVSREIRIGLIQSLLVKIFKGQPNTGYQDLYISFIKNLSKYSKVTESDPILTYSFRRVNERYFNGLMDRPNLVWGKNSTSKLGSYEYQTNTISVSTIFKQGSDELLDYIMYHELLHKKHKFYSKSGRSYHHTTAFKHEEKKFENLPIVEKELKNLCRKSKIKTIFFKKWI